MSRRLQFLGRRLDLSAEQLAELDERLGRHRAKGRELVMAHRAERIDIINEVLDEEQAERFAAMRRRRAEHHGRHRRRGRGRGWAEAPDSPATSEDDVLA